MSKAKNEKKSLSFSEFELEHLVFEVRYPVSAMYLTSSGYFWQKLTKTLPEQFRFGDLESNQTSAIYGNNFEIVSTPDKLIINQFYPKKSIDNTIETIKQIFDLAIETLEIEYLLRVGLRLIFVKGFESDKLVSKSLFQMPFFNLPKDLNLGTKGEWKIPALAVGWEDDTKGISYRIRGAGRKMNIDVPLVLHAKGVLPEYKSYEDHNCIFDVDTYIKQTIPIGKFFINEWIKQSFETANQDGQKFFRGK